MIPALDATAFEQLAEDLESHAIASEFLVTFDALLADRIQRIEHALEAQDEEEITTALLSLQASAAMAGAAQLEASATRALARPAESTPPGPLVQELRGHADVFRTAFADFHHAGYAHVMHASSRSNVA